jgi:hypothetical protein
LVDSDYGGDGHWRSEVKSRPLKRLAVAMLAQAARDAGGYSLKGEVDQDDARDFLRSEHRVGPWLMLISLSPEPFVNRTAQSETEDFLELYRTFSGVLNNRMVYE